jgi:uncharacterized protein (TIGR03435 family)
MKWMTAASCIVFSILTANGQAMTTTPEFEVASVKPADKQERDQFRNAPGPVAEMMGFEGGPGTKDPGRIFYHGVSLKMVLARAYKMKPEQISGPSWLGSELYTIEAKLPPGTDAEGLRSMLQKLLTERFQMSLHKEVKETPVYRLKVAKNGPKLKPAEPVPHYENEDEKRETLQKRVEAMMAAMKANREKGISTPGRSFSLAHATTARFAETLSGHLDRPVKDMTQLEGEYSFHLAYDPDGGAREDGLSIFTAIQEQLRLKLEAGNEPIELLVIDKVEKVPVRN